MDSPQSEYSEEFLELVKSIKNKRAQVVINYIFENGFITTEDLENAGYSHAPRAARDVREAGIPLTTFTVKSTSGKSIAAYKFGDLSQIQANRNAGRILFTKDFKSRLYLLCNGKCSICNTAYEERYLQVDHRVPYQIGGDLGLKRVYSDFMLICASCNRAKSWTCEHCENWLKIKNSELCMSCYWGSPEHYNHIALQEMRRIDITWKGNEVKYYDEIRKLATENNIALPEFIKNLIIPPTNPEHSV